MAKLKARANIDVLKWARAEAGLSVADAAHKSDVSQERLASWESGVDQPTIPQLRRLAQIYKRPLAVFYLAEVPRAFRVQHDFRRLPGEVAGIYSTDLRLDLRIAAYHRDVALQLLTELAERAPPFQFSASPERDPEVVGESLRAFLGMGAPMREEPRLAFNRWRKLVEDKGVLVFQMARVSVLEMRGFSLSIDPLPVIAVNRKDAWAGRLFSLLHELAHIALHRGGICDIDETAARSPEEQHIEVLCNHIAGAAIVPQQYLLANAAVSANRGSTWGDDALRAIAADFGVSREVVMRRLLALGRTTEAAYREARERLLQEYADRRDSRRTRDRPFARNMPRETVGLLGRPFVGLVLDTYSQDRITLSDVATYLGVRVKHVDEIARLARAR